MPTGITEPKIRAIGLIESRHSRDVTQVAGNYAIVGYTFSWNCHHVPNSRTLARFVVDNLRSLSISKMGGLADYQDPVA